jgi:putative endonuclease
VADPRSELGLEGERLAESYLRRQGLKTLERRFSTPVGELDLVMRAGETVVFVEVKTLRQRGGAEPQDKVDRVKQRKLWRAAEWFLHRKRWESHPCRFDVVGLVVPEQGETEIRHFPEAFQP